MNQMQDEMICELVDRIREGRHVTVTEEEEKMIFDVVKKVIDDMWTEVNPKGCSTIGKKQILKLLSTQFDVQHVTDDAYKAIFAKTEFSMLQEIDQFELAIFLLSVSGLSVLIDEERIENRLYYREVYQRRPYTKRINKEERKLRRQYCLTSCF